MAEKSDREARWRLRTQGASREGGLRPPGPGLGRPLLAQPPPPAPRPAPPAPRRASAGQQPAAAGAAGPGPVSVSGPPGWAEAHVGCLTSPLQAWGPLPGRLVSCPLLCLHGAVWSLPPSPRQAPENVPGKLTLGRDRPPHTLTATQAPRAEPQLHQTLPPHVQSQLPKCSASLHSKLPASPRSDFPLRPLSLPWKPVRPQTSNCQCTATLLPAPGAATPGRPRPCVGGAVPGVPGLCEARRQPPDPRLSPALAHSRPCPAGRPSCGDRGGGRTEAAA